MVTQDGMHARSCGDKLECARGITSGIAICCCKCGHIYRRINACPTAHGPQGDGLEVITDEGWRQGSPATYTSTVGRPQALHTHCLTQVMYIHVELLKIYYIHYYNIPSELFPEWYVQDAIYIYIFIEYEMSATNGLVHNTTIQIVSFWIYMRREKIIRRFTRNSR